RCRPFQWLVDALEGFPLADRAAATRYLLGDGRALYRDAGRTGAQARSTDLPQPVVEVVVIADARDARLAVDTGRDVEERAARRHVALAMRRRESFIGDQVLAVHHFPGGSDGSRDRTVATGPDLTVVRMSRLPSLPPGRGRGWPAAARRAPSERRRIPRTRACRRPMPRCRASVRGSCGPCAAGTPRRRRGRFRAALG